jgi:Dyp-type peroxidase family
MFHLTIGEEAMADLETILANPIDWRKAATDDVLRAFLQDLQANILKGHGRFNTAHVFLSFDGMAPAAVAEIIRAIGSHCTSAYKQLLTNKKLPPYLDGGVVRCFFLSARGYNALGGLAQLPPGDAFAAGMASRHEVLTDPDRTDWNVVGWRDAPPSAMILVAAADVDAVTADLEAIEGWLNGTGVQITVIERGLQQTRQFRQGERPEGVEHFGYVDGRSQPLVLSDDVAAEPHVNWRSAFPPSQFIVPDPNGRNGVAAGSYFVFRKLEQDVRGFNEAEDALGKSLFGDNATEDQLDRAGAMVVGRFEDGTALVLSATGLKQSVPNDFTYASDPNGLKCPFHAHIRKTNPRGDVQNQFNLPDENGDRAPIMIRRGITYGAKRPMSADGSEFDDAGEEPQHNSGLLFMAYMASLEAQFEFTQKSWANNSDFVRPATGIDPVIGQSSNQSQHTHIYQDGWFNGAAQEFSFQNFVHMQGGEYFFAPSLSFLRGVGL